MLRIDYKLLQTITNLYKLIFSDIFLHFLSFFFAFLPVPPALSGFITLYRALSMLTDAYGSVRMLILDNCGQFLVTRSKSKLGRSAGLNLKQCNRAMNCTVKLKLCIEAERQVLQGPGRILSRRQSAPQHRTTTKIVQKRRMSTTESIPRMNLANQTTSTTSTNQGVMHKEHRRPFFLSGRPRRMSITSGKLNRVEYIRIHLSGSIRIYTDLY